MAKYKIEIKNRQNQVIKTIVDDALTNKDECINMLEVEAQHHEFIRASITNTQINKTLNFFCLCGRVAQSSI